jgi:hypothetical protein
VSFITLPLTLGNTTASSSRADLLSDAASSGGPAQGYHTGYMTNASVPNFNDSGYFTPDSSQKSDIAHHDDTPANPFCDFGLDLNYTSDQDTDGGLEIPNEPLKPSAKASGKQRKDYVEPSELGYYPYPGEQYNGMLGSFTPNIIVGLENCASSPTKQKRRLFVQDDDGDDHLQAALRKTYDLQSGDGDASVQDENTPSKFLIGATGANLPQQVLPANLSTEQSNTVNAPTEYESIVKQA